jgi:SAM-dependent methyltransferase
MPRNEEHSLLVTPDARQAARQRFVLTLKQDLGRRLRPQLKNGVAENVRESDDVAALSAALEASAARKLWGRLSRSAQELMWSAVAEPLEAQELDLSERCTALIQRAAAGGTLELDPELQVPEAMLHIPVHLQPGGYCRENIADDVMAGALYEAGGALYSQGQSIGLSESKAELVIRFLEQEVPGFKPVRVLDMGCSAGGSTTPYARLYPGADIHALDVAPGLLRYAAARAEAMGLAIHFHQRDACHAGFDDGSFDLVVSHNAMHEMSPETIAAMMRESYRLLRPGGIAVHQDVPLRNAELDAWSQADYAWDRLHNNEPYWNSFAAMDLEQTLREAGFGAAVRRDRVLQLGGGMAWDLVWATRGEN